MRYLIAFLLVIAMGAPGFAQEKTYTVTMSSKYWDKALESLSKEPYKDVWLIIQSILSQAKTQDMEDAKKVVEPPKEPQK